ncbi:signal peptidase I [Thiolinea disciformis]|uniref:signal peptidase I n=1 Tax=Thiolinea disciformis TaxID=125614 RepID=UPI0003815EF2|nr:signal peptidase I [Thiolinea disciformis]
MPQTVSLYRRQPLMAFLLSAILPGLGQIYNGELNKAAWFFLIFTSLSVPALGFSLVHLPAAWGIWAIALFTGLSSLVWLANMIQAFRSAYRQPAQPLHSWQGFGVYLLVALLMLSLFVPWLSQTVRSRWVDMYLIPSASMEPNLIAGDYILADMRYNCPNCEFAVKRGDIAIFVYPNDRTIRYVKRVIGLPGDHVQLTGSELRVNDKLLTQSITAQADMDVVQESDADNTWVVVWKDRNKEKNTKIDVKVPPGQVFVMGDNRTNSSDSRVFGSVPMEDIFGRARQILVSYNKEKKVLVENRSGTALHPSAVHGTWTDWLDRFKPLLTADEGGGSSKALGN